MIPAIIKGSIANRFIILVLAFMMGAVGIWAIRETPVDAIPDLSDVQVIVRTPYPGQAPQVVENQITYPLATAMLAVPGAQDALLFGWLQRLYPIWARFGPEEVFVSAQIGLAELALSVCTLTSDHLYLYPNGARLDDTVAAAREVGLRFHPTRGAMSIGESDGGLPPDALGDAVDVIFTTPSHQCPSSATMPLARRHALLKEHGMDLPVSLEG